MEYCALVGGGRSSWDHRACKNSLKSSCRAFSTSVNILYLVFVRNVVMFYQVSVMDLASPLSFLFEVFLVASNSGFHLHQEEACCLT